MDHLRLTRNARGDWEENAPKRCPNGHKLGPRTVLVCSCEVHHHPTHRCRECEAVTYTPTLGQTCQSGSFDGRASSR